MSSQPRDISNDVAMTRADLVRWMSDQKMSVSDLAELLGITNQAVLYWVSGQRNIPEPIGRILVFLGQRPDMMREF